MVFRPFQRLGDRDNTSGVGLGLALSRGLAGVRGGSLVPEDTPGGGVTMVLSIPAALDGPVSAGNAAALGLGGMGERPVPPPARRDVGGSGIGLGRGGPGSGSGSGSGGGRGTTQGTGTGPSAGTGTGTQEVAR